MAAIDTRALERDGYVVLPEMVSASEIAEFEALIEQFSDAQIKRFGLTQKSADPFIDVFSRGGGYKKRVYKLLENLFVLHRISVRIGDALIASGFVDWAGIKVPLIWPDIRADLPHDSQNLLPVHQDFGSTMSRYAWRMWIPLRPSNAHFGTMSLYPGTHKKGPIPHNAVDPKRPFVEPRYYAGIEPTSFDLAAGDGVLIDPLILHASVPNRSNRTKFTLMIQIQDYASVIDPDDQQDEFAHFARITAERAKARAAAGD